MIAVSLLLIDVLYNVFIREDSVTKEDFIGLSVVLLITIICFITDILGLSLIKRFSEPKGISNKHRILLIVFYVFLCVLILALIGMIYFLITDFYSFKDREKITLTWDNVEYILLSLIVGILFLTTLIKLIFQWRLMKDVKANSSEMGLAIDSIGNKLSE